MVLLAKCVEDRRGEMAEKQPLTGKEYVERKTALEGASGCGCLCMIFVPVTGLAIYVGWYNPWLIGGTVVLLAFAIYSYKRAYSKEPLDKD